MCEAVSSCAYGGEGYTERAVLALHYVEEGLGWWGGFGGKGNGTGEMERFKTFLKEK